MKNQYFGDNRDLFKYDLILEIFKKTDLPNQFTFFPMLTGNDDTGGGGNTDRKTAKAGTENADLIKFLDKCISLNRRNIEELGGFFRGKGIETYIHEGTFTSRGRQLYFAGISDSLLSESLIAIDPDVGLENEKPSKKHILFAEVKDLHCRMSKESVLMLFQFIPRIKRDEYFPEICKNFEKQVGDVPIYISDNQIVFFFLAKNTHLKKLLTKVISAYGERYKLRVGNVEGAFLC